MSTPLDERLHGLVSVGAGRVGQEIRDARDRFVASDPGWARLRQGIRAIVAVGTTLLLEFVLATVVGQPVLLAMLLGAVVAMLMSTGIRESRRDVILKIAAATPLLAAAGASLGVITAQHRLLGLITFVLVSFVAVWVRRFGPRWFTFGFLFWQSFFFALFLDPPVGLLPFLLLAILLSCTWVALLLVSVLYDDPQQKLQRIVTALRARARAGIAAAVDVLDDPQSTAAVRQLRRQLLQLTEIALLLDGQLSDSRVLPDGVSAARVRRWVVDVEIGLDEVAGATIAIAAHRDELAAGTLGHVRTTLQALGWADYPAARSAAADLQAAAGEQPAVRRLGSAALFLLDTVETWMAGDLVGPPGDDPLDDDTDFEPVVTLIGGNLPGSAALAQQTITRADAGRLSPSRMKLTTRQAIQAGLAAALAIVAGEAISPQRFYWAVIAAFVAFAGTSTSGETLRKGAGRIFGTMLGLIAAVGLADLTDGHRPAAIAAVLVCIFLAFFLQAVSYGLMIFFITVMLGQLYTLLGTFSDELLLVRLSETVAGAVIGVLVSLLVLPTHSRATLRVARQSFLGALADLLDACGATLDGVVPDRDLLSLTIALDAGGRQLVRARHALTKGRLFGGDRAGLRHRVSVLGNCGASARAVAAAIGADRPNPALAQACRLLALQARDLAQAPNLRDPRPPVTGLADPTATVRPLLADLPADNAAATHSLRRLGEGLALLSQGQPVTKAD